MKLQNMTVIFIIIMIPIIIVVSYYIGLEINTIKMQKDYDVKLQTATQDSIQALEINTVEWNSASSNLADSKRRDVLAAINTFTTSLANSMGIGGAAKGRVQTYIPAIAYTMYDGYYIYSASPMREQQKDEKGLTIFEAGGNIQYSSNDPTYQYVLKPYSPYSARYVTPDNKIDVTVNYTLDNYIRVYGKVGTGDQDKSVAKEGYLVVCDRDEGVNNVNSGTISGIKYRRANITPEELKEQVYYIDEEGNNRVVEYPYIYDQYDNKLYWDEKADPNGDGTKEGNYFSINKNNQKVYLQNALPEGDSGFAIYNRFRKISIPQCVDREWTVLKIFQILNPDGDNKFYYQDKRGAYIEFSLTDHKIGEIAVEDGLGNSIIKDKDFSAINYCVESYVFTQWVTSKLSNITVGNMQVVTKNNNTKPLSSLTSDEQKYYEYNNVDSGTQIFSIDQNNNPDPENDTAYANSILAQHKKDVIINTIEKNLAQATAQAQEMNVNYEYRLPQLSYEEWEQALSNISIIAFMQGMPIGLKYYNNYAIATSTLNKEYLDPDEIYFSGTGDSYYHQRQCGQAIGSNYVGYRSIEYVAKSYEITEASGNKKTEYYYPHDNNDPTNIDSELECYYCLVNRSTYDNSGTTDEWTDSYYNALARERYMQWDEPGTYKPNVTITKSVVASDEPLEYGGELIYTIEITNNGAIEDTIILKDYWNKSDMSFERIERKYANKGSSTAFTIDKKDEVEKTGIEIDNIKIKSGETITIEYKTKIKANVGTTIANTASVYSYVNDTTALATATKNTPGIEKRVTFSIPEINSSNYNIIFLLDHSNSMSPGMTRNMYQAIADLTAEGGAIDQLYQRVNTNGGNVNLSIIQFAKFIRDEYIDINTIDGLRDISDDYNRNTGIDADLVGTNYQGALERAYDLLGTESNTNNIVVFLTDGSPTSIATPTTEYRIYREDGSETESYQCRTWPGLGNESLWHSPTFINRRVGPDVWNGIKSIVSQIKDTQSTEIYCINYGADGARYGLETIISSGEGYYKEASEEDIQDIFTGIVTDITPPEIDTAPRYSENGIITLTNPEEIDYIKVNENIRYINALTKPIGENGELDLTQFKAGDKIEIVYH